MSQDDSQSLLARVTRDGIVETAVKKSVDFIVRLGERPDMGRNIYKQLFPKSKDKAKEKTDSFSSVVRYCQRLQQSNYNLCFAYKPGKDAGGFGRLYAQTRQNFVPTSQQMMRASVRQFLQTYQHSWESFGTINGETLEQALERHKMNNSLYKDYDIKASHWSMLLRLCKRHKFACDELQRVHSIMVHSIDRRQAFFDEHNTTKDQMNANLNKDKPWGVPTGLKQLFAEVKNAKRFLYDHYRGKGYRSKPKTENPISSLVHYVLGEEENKMLMSTIANLIEEGFMDESDLGPIAFDGFNAKKALPLEFMNDMNKGVVWAEKANKFEVDIDYWVDQLNRTDETATFDIKAEEYYYVEGKARVRPFQASLDGDGRLNIVERSAMGMGKTYQTKEFIINMRQQHDSFNVLVISHRISLIRDAVNKYYRDLEFSVYFDFKGRSVTEAGNHVVCINSLHHFKSNEYDLVIIDELPEVLESLVTCNL